MKIKKWIGAISIIFFIALLVTACNPPGENVNSVNLSSYFPATQGYHLEYDFVTDGSGNFSIDFYYKGGTPLTRYAFGYDSNPAHDTFDDSPAHAYYSIASLTDGDHDIGTVIYND